MNAPKSAKAGQTQSPAPAASLDIPAGFDAVGDLPDQPIAQPPIPTSPSADAVMAPNGEFVTKADLSAIVGDIFARFEKRAEEREKRQDDRFRSQVAPILDRSRQRGMIDGISETADKILDIPVDGLLEDVRRTDLHLERADPMTWENKAAEIAFLNEPVVVEIAESTNPNDQNVVMLSINGRPIWVERGKPTRMRRCYLEQLCRIKPQGIKTHVSTNRDGDPVNRVVKKTGMGYPFRVIEDRNPRGKPWLQRLLKEG